MAKRRAKRTVKQSASSPSSNINGDGPKEPSIVEKEDAFRDHEVERRSAAIRAIRDMEIDHLLTGLRLLRSYYSKEQLQTPVLQFFEENLPNLSVVKNGRDGQYDVQWKNTDGNLPMNQADGRNIHSSLLHCLSTAYADCSTAIPSFGGFEFSSKAVNASLIGGDNMQIRDFVLEEPADTQMLGLQDGLQTPGVCSLFSIFDILFLSSALLHSRIPSTVQKLNVKVVHLLMKSMSSQRMSVGMTPKTLRLPKNGEMLLSVHGSPLGVYKEDNMESIRGG